MGIPMICLLFVWYCKAQGLIVFELWENKALCAVHWRVQESPQQVKGMGSLTIGPLHCCIIANYKEAHLNFSHLKDDCLS